MVRNKEYKELREKITEYLWHFGQPFKLPRQAWSKTEYDYADEIISVIPSNPEEIRR